MKVEGVVLSHVFEVGIESIMLNLPADSKKVVMPLRFSVKVLPSSFSIYIYIFAFFLLSSAQYRSSCVDGFPFSFSDQATTDGMEHTRNEWQIQQV